jgi:formylglycine-generating enzyme required for sulfatase activity
MAPELWHGEQASRASDVYATGIVLYALVSGRTPYAGLSLTELAAAILAGNYRPIDEVAPNVDARFASIVERCLRISPAERYASGEELRSALEILTPLGRNRQIPTGNPYRGLQAFQAEHRSLFFGRSVEIRAVVERLRADSFVLVAGDSGVGKSSLCRAGAVPLIQDGAIEPDRTWSSAAMMPGRKPLQVLVSVLAGYLDVDEEIIHAMILESAVTFSWYLRKQLGNSRGLVIFIDQLEELVTISDKEQAALVGAVLSQISAGIPGVRLMASARGDFLTRVAEIPELGEEISRAIYLLRPLTREGAREAISGPAELQGVRFESEELVDELIDAGVEGSLPLLQFALAELWNVRDEEAGVITRADLDQIGGVTGALARHGDGVLASLLPQARTEARRILVRLVTIEDTRANLTEDELTGENAEAQTALEALVRSRLLVVRETADGIIYEIAHEALIGGWGTLRSWLDEEREGRILLHSLETAASEWERLGKPRDALWGTAALTRASLYLDDSSLRPREREFLTASRRAVARGRQLRRAALVAIPLVLGSVYGVVKINEYRAVQARVAEKIEEGRAAFAEAGGGAERIRLRRAEAFKLFDAQDAEAGEEVWAEVVAETPKVDASYKEALQALEAALILDPGSEDAHGLLAEVLFARALLAEQEHESKQVEELRERLELYDREGRFGRLWEEPGRLRIGVRPPGTTVEIGEYKEVGGGRLALEGARVLGETPLADVELSRGSYLLTFSTDGVSVRYPLVVQRGEELEIGFDMPGPQSIPEGFVFVPPGRFLVGSADDETMRKLFFYAPPLHMMSGGAYLIGEEEVSFADWIDYVESLPEDEQAKALPNTERVKLERDGVTWKISFGADDGFVSARVGEDVVLAERSAHAREDWLEWPVVGVGIQEARGYASWLDRTGKVPRARLCTEFEWEHAARGADGRSYGHGHQLDADDANYDQTFGFAPAALGPTAGGTFRNSRSPFGLYDTVGNAMEWTDSAMGDGGLVFRGGGFPYDSIQARVYNRAVVVEDFRDWSGGLRVCAPFGGR